MTRLYAGLAALLILVASLAGLVAWGRQGHKSAQEAHQKLGAMATQLDASNAALRAYKRNAEVERVALQNRAQVQARRLQTEQAKTKELQDALEANRDWADQPLPDGVRRALDGVPGE